MIDQADDASWMPRTSSVPMDGLRQLAEPPQRVLADFIRKCSPDPSARSTVVAAWVIAHWQMAGRRLGSTSPSLLLVNCGQKPDPVYGLVESLLTDGDRPPGACDQGPFVHGTPEQAPGAMQAALQRRQGIPGNMPWHALQVRDEANYYHAAKRTCFGGGISMAYHRAWHPRFGLLADEQAELVLRVSAEEDVEAFRKDLLETPVKLVYPSALDGRLNHADAHVAVMGSLPSGKFNGELAASCFSIGIPLLTLPHRVDAQPKIPNPAAWSTLSHLWKNRGKLQAFPVRPEAYLPENQRVRVYEEQLRIRLSRLPGAYEFSILQMVHQLAGVCEQLVRSMVDHDATGKEIGALIMTLYEHTLRSIVISAASIDWHLLSGLTSDTDELRPAMVKIRRKLRRDGPATLTTLSKNLNLTKRLRDHAVEVLVDAGLVEVDGKTVRALNFAEFVGTLHARPDIPAPKDYLSSVFGEAVA